MRWINRTPDRAMAIFLAMLALRGCWHSCISRLPPSAWPKTRPTSCCPALPPWPAPSTSWPSSPIRAPGTYLFWADTRASLARLAAGLGHRHRNCAECGPAYRHVPLCPCAHLRPGGRPLHGAAARPAADPLHRHGSGRGVEDHAHRHRHRPGDDPRPRAAYPGTAARAVHQGADPRRLVLADRRCAWSCRRRCRGC